MSIKRVSKARQGRTKWSLFLVLAAALFMLAGDVIAQTYYNIELRQRRMGDSIGVEIWIKSLTSDAPKVGDMSIAVTYNTTNLEPADPDDYDGVLYQTDSVDYDVNQSSPLPYRDITSPFYSSGGYGFLDPVAQAADNPNYSVYRYDVRLSNSPSSSDGFQPYTYGRGTFVGMLRFKIQNHTSLTDATLSQIEINSATEIGDFKIFDVDGNNVESNTTFTTTPDFTIRGITILNPNGPYEAVNRNKTYPSLSVAGYPIYFERSGLITPAALSEYGSDVLAYAVDYSTDGGTSWSDEVMRFAEKRDVYSGLANPGYYSYGEVETGNGYIVTQGDGSQLPVETTPGYSGVLRVIWDDDQNFAPRSEEARLRITQLETSNNAADINSTRQRETDAIYDISDADFVLSRLFFAQLDGSTEYFRTRDDYSNSTQLTVEAWINLNSYSTVDGAEPGIIATGPGAANTEEEGAWILYLDDGKYPAFRAQEIIGGAGRGENGGDYIATVVSPEAIDTTNDGFPINDNANHPGNWTHVAATVANNVVSLYVDGELKAQTTNNNDINIRMATYEHPIWVGVNPIGGIQAGDYLHAGIKEVRVWRTALTQTELRARVPGIDNPDTWSTNPDVKSALELYYDFVGTATDNADHVIQNGVNPIYFYQDPSLTATYNNTLIDYRPDRAHVKLTSPVGGEGVSNLEDETYNIRWVAYGVGNRMTSPTDDLVIEFTRDGGTNWACALDNVDPGVRLDDVDMEDNTATWEPYNSVNVLGGYLDLRGVTPVASNYAKTVKLRIRGTSANEQTDIYDMSDDFTVAPHFALRNTGNSIVAVPDGTTMNMTGSAGFLEAWIRPYTFPSSGNSYPLVVKMDSTNSTVHYAFRLLSTGQLQLQVNTSGGEARTAVSDSEKPIPAPNVEEMDSAWTHVGVYFNLANGSGQTDVRFYIDGTVHSSSTLTQQLGTNLTVSSSNTFPTFIGYEPGTTPSYFIGEMKEIRYWNGVPAGMAVTGNEPTDLTNFIRGAACVRASELQTTPTNYRQNLAAAFTMEDCAFVEAGVPYYMIPSAVGSAYAQIMVDNGVDYNATEPYIKVVEPIFGQIVPNTTEELLVRWVGFDYDRDMFYTGDNIMSVPSDLEYSVYAGGEDEQWPYNPASSDYENTTFTPDAFTLPSTSTYRFSGISPVSDFVQFGGLLDVSIADADDDDDGSYGNDDRGPIAASQTNARLRFRGRATINDLAPEEYTTYEYLRAEGPIFTITPPSNFTVRVLLEGFHNGTVSAITGSLGTTYETNGLRITLYNSQSSLPSTSAGTAVSTQGYAQTDPLANPARGTTLSGSASQFADVPFVFTEVLDGDYFVVVQHQNHLPIMSKYVAPFQFDGDDASTWEIESGWDFQMWDGDETNVLEEDDATPSGINTSQAYSAYGYVSTDVADPDYGTTGLIFNDGNGSETVSANSLAAMVAGDVESDGHIDAGDRVKVRDDAGTAQNYESDANGDGDVNSTDRNIVDKNTGMESSIANLSLMTEQEGGDLPPTIAAPYDPYEVISDRNPELSRKLNEYARIYDENPSNADKSGKNRATILSNGNYKYRVIGEAELIDDKIELSIYFLNEGDDFAPGNCTFAVKYDPSLLIFDELTDENGLWSQVPDKGYVNQMYSAPLPNGANPLPDVRTIEIDYDFYTRKSGNLFPRQKTLIGKLVFTVRQVSEEYAFSWYKSTAIYKTDGTRVTGDGIFEDIKPISTVKYPFVTVPNGGETWRAGKSYTISWTESSNDYAVFVELSTDNGKSWMRITEQPVGVNQLELDWISLKINSTECLIRLINSEDGTEVDRSDNIFALVPALAYITRPAASDPIYYGGNEDYIRWVMNDQANVRFEFSENGQSNWRPVGSMVSSDNEEVEWRIPGVNSKNAVVTMISNTTGEVIAVSEPFKILAGNVDLISPSSGEELRIGNAKKIRWNSDNVNHFDMQFSADGGQTWVNLANGVNALKKNYNWTVPMVKTEHAVIRAIWNGDPDMEYSRTPEFKIDGVVGVEDDEEELATDIRFTVEEPFPNPFNYETSIRFSLPQTEMLYVSVYNSAGMKVADLINGEYISAGSHTLVFSANELPSGVYFIRFFAGSHAVTKELMLVK